MLQSDCPVKWCDLIVTLQLRRVLKAVGRKADISEKNSDGVIRRTACRVSSLYEMEVCEDVARLFSITGTWHVACGVLLVGGSPTNVRVSNR